MINTLFGPVEDNYDYAKKIVKELDKRPFYLTKTGPTKVAVTFDIEHKDEMIRNLAKFDLQCSGNYVIYRKVGKKIECDYTGVTISETNTMWIRIQRWFKQLAGKSHKDEKHCGAIKAYKDGVRITDEFYIKLLPEFEFPDRKKDGIYDLKTIDEYIATLLNAKYNTRKRHSKWKSFFG